jgi:maltose alpha-D-glucosyltransferase/alpha-amylase
MQLFGRGLRRRIPAMFGGDQQRIRMAYSLLFALPGAPVLFYGEEIGMGENLDIPGRTSVRTPMQWTPEPTGGFSTVRPTKLHRRPPDGRFSPLAVNVEAQRREPDSQLNWTERLIRRRRELPELGWGAVAVLDVRAESVLAHTVEAEDRTLLFVHQLAPEACEITLQLPCDLSGSRVLDLVDGLSAERVDDNGRLTLVLGPYAHHWLAVEHAGSRRTP